MGFNPSIVSQIGRFLVRLQTSGQSATTDTPGFKPFTILRSLGRQSERLANNYISLVSTVSRIRQQLWFNHRCKDQGLVPLLPTNLLDTVTTIANRRADKTTDRVRTEQERKLITLQRNKDRKRPKTDDNWVRNVSSRLLDKTETHVLSYGLKHSVTPKTETDRVYCI